MLSHVIIVSLTNPSLSFYHQIMYTHDSESSTGIVLVVRFFSSTVSLRLRVCVCCVFSSSLSLAPHIICFVFLCPSLLFSPSFSLFSSLFCLFLSLSHVSWKHLSEHRQILISSIILIVQYSFSRILLRILYISDAVTRRIHIYVRVTEHVRDWAKLPELCVNTRGSADLRNAKGEAKWKTKQKAKR